jgi:hypothetical protein
MPPRCPNGTRRNKKTGLCEAKNISFSQSQSQTQKQKRCPNGSHRNKKTGLCEPNKNKSVKLSSVKKSANLEDKGATKIQKFMLKNKNKIRALFLNTICSDSGSCIALGTNANKIKQFFNGFVDFSYLRNISKIGKSSANGAVYQLEYAHRNYNSHAILKMNSINGSDSLLYEYFVGIRINHFAKYFPNFLETYGSYTIDPNIWNKIISGSNFTKLEFKEKLQLNPVNIHDIAGSCNLDYYKKYAILIQHLKVKKDEETLMDCMNVPMFVKNDLVYVLYQIYATLSSLKNEYTHYDLHMQNVMMYVPNENQYIEYHYHYPNGTIIKFKSKYIVKIIDYGRNYINVDGMSENSQTFYKKLCEAKECNYTDPLNKLHKCGEYFGYNFFDPSVDIKNYFITSSKKNNSHDLRLAFNIFNTFPNELKQEFPYLHRILSAVRYTTKYGTKELASGLPDYIHNVKDMEEILFNIVNNPVNITENDSFYYNKSKMGDLHVYMDMSKPMEYVSV